MNKNKKAGIKDIAALTGVSIGTVDRVLHNRSGVSEKTKTLVLEKIHELGYKPNEIARSMATGRKFSIISLTPRPSEWNSYWKQPLNGIMQAQKEISAFGVKTKNFHFNINDPKHFEDISNKVIAEKPDGILLAPVHSSISGSFIEKCKNMGIELVLFDSISDKTDCASCIAQDPYRSGEVAARLMSQTIIKGATILIINAVWASRHSEHLKERERGFREWIVKNARDAQYDIISISLPDEPITGKDYNIPLKFDALFATSNASRLSKVIEPALLKSSYIISYDLTEKNLEFLKSEIINVLIGQRPEYQGYAGIYTLFNILVRKKKYINNNSIPVDIVIKENYLDYINHQPGIFNGE